MRSHGAGACAGGELLTGVRLMANDWHKELNRSDCGVQCTLIKFQGADLHCPVPFI